jgi:hypothetical protein
MPRSQRIRNFINEYNESPKVEKMSFIPPFFILALEFILIIHAILNGNLFVIIITSILVIISFIEIIFVSREINEHYKRINFDREMTIRLDDFIIEKNEKNVKKIIEEFINEHPNYNTHRNEIYHVACQIMETHKEEMWERTLDTRLKKYIEKNKRENIRTIIEKFIEKYPEYKKYPEKVYPLAAQMIDKYKSIKRKRK